MDRHLSSEPWTMRRFKEARDALIERGILRKRGWGPRARLELTERGREMARAAREGG